MLKKSISPQEWEIIERDEHDIVYRDNHPFFFDTDIIDVHAVIQWEDYCFKKDRRPDRGHRTKRLFGLIGIHDLRDKRILDVGCGNGQYAVLFAMLGAEVHAFDLSPVGVDCGRRFAKANGVADRCHFSVQNAAATNYDAAMFDIVIMHEVLHHAIKYPNVAPEMARVLKPGGKLVSAETLRGNALLDIARRISMRGEEAKGDVILTLDDFEQFGASFARYEVEPMSLLFMGRRLFRTHMHLAPVRLFLRAVKVVDDVLLGMIPTLRRYCGECVAVFHKAT